MTTNVSAYKSLFVLIAILLILAPRPLTIQLLSLQLHYSFPEFIIEFWRVFTSHFVHASWEHLLVNCTSLILLRLAFTSWLEDKRLLFFLLFNALLISLGLWWISPSNYYLGFSGLFHSLLLYLLLRYWPSAKILFSIGIALLALKIAQEQLSGASPWLAEFIGISIATDAHLLGIISGLLFFILEKYLCKFDRFFC